MNNIPLRFFRLPLIAFGLFAAIVFLSNIFASGGTNENYRDRVDCFYTARAAQTKQMRLALTASQKKIDSQLLYAIYRKQGGAKAKNVPPGNLLVKFDGKGRAIVTIRARVTRTVLAKIEMLGGEVISSSETYNDIRACLPLEKLEKLAALRDVQAIMPGQESITN